MSAITFKAYDANGNPLAKAFLESLYLCSLDYSRVFKTNILDIYEGTITLAVPNEPFQAAMILPVDGFGAVYNYADNEGAGYAGTERELDFCYEAARTRLTKVSAWMREQQERGFNFSPDVSQRLNAAEGYFRQAESFSSLSESLWAGELAVLEKARKDIQQRGWREEFLFGCNCFGHPEQGPKYDELFKELLNFGTMPFYWRYFEPRRGEKGWDRTDELAKWLKQNKITAKGHPLVCFFCTPEWAKDLDYETFKATHRDEIYEIVKHYQGAIDIFDVINEAHDWANELGFTQSQLVEMTKLACDTAKEANPGAIRIVNSCEPWGIYAATNTPQKLRGKSDRPLTTPYRYLQNCLRANMDFEVVGLQMYFGYGEGLSCHDMFEINLMLERFAAFNKPIHISEIGCLGGGDINKALNTAFYWHRSCDEQTQAEWGEALYTLCYSKPYITAITWWTFNDAGAYDGLVTQDLSPKEIYHSLKRLFKSWRAMGSISE